MVVRVMATVNPTTRVRAARREQGAAPPHERQAECGEGDELWAQHHGADDEDLGVHDDGDGRQQGGQGHEGQVGPVELGLLVGALGDVGPHDGIGAGAGGVAFGVEPGTGDPGGDRFDVDGAPLGDSEPDQAVDVFVGGLPGHVGQHDVAFGFQRRASQHGEVAHRRVVGEHGDHLVGQVGWDGDPQGLHRGSAADVDDGAPSGLQRPRVEPAPLMDIIDHVSERRRPPRLGPLGSAERARTPRRGTGRMGSVEGPMERSWRNELLG